MDNDIWTMKLSYNDNIIDFKRINNFLLKIRNLVMSKGFGCNFYKRFRWIDRILSKNVV
jgi:hypothetical protein